MPTPILELQKRMREVGRIRLGDKSDRGAPRKLANFRLTCANRQLLDTAASLYGGTVRAWKGAPNEGTWELYTERDRIPVLVPPGQILSQAYELWSGGGCQRRCDGIIEQISGEPCMCPADDDERRKLAQDGQACKLTTRFSIMVPNIPDVGLWRMESHGYYAAVELAGTMAVLERATRTGALVEAQLRIDQRSVKRNGVGTLRYIVPVLELPDVTPYQLAREYGMLPAGVERPMVQSLPAPAEVESQLSHEPLGSSPEPGQQALDPESKRIADIVADIDRATSADEITRIARDAGALMGNREIKQAMTRFGQRQRQQGARR